MMLMLLLTVTNDVMMKAVLTDIPIFQSLFVRGLMLTPLVLFLLYWRGELVIKVNRTDKLIIFMRMCCEVGLAYSILAALKVMPLANVVTILQCVPFGMTIAAALFLYEKVNWLRWVSVLVGFAGVLFIVRPGTDGFSYYSLYALLAVILFVVRDVLVRKLSANLPSTFLAAPLVIAVTIAGGIMTPFSGWQPLQAWHLLLLFGAGLAITTSYLLAIIIMRTGEVSFVSPFRYSGIIWAILAGIFIFDEWPDTLALTGATIIMLAGIVVIRSDS